MSGFVSVILWLVSTVSIESAYTSLVHALICIDYTFPE